MKPENDFSLISSEGIENHLGKQIEAIRLSRNITQSQLATAAGVSRSTISRLARPDAGISLDSFIRILQALNLETQLESLLPDPSVRPLQNLLATNRTRQRARQVLKVDDKKHPNLDLGCRRGQSVTTASVELWGRQIGAVSWLADRGFGVFEYTREFAASAIQVSPVMMPLREAPYQFPALPRETFKGSSLGCWQTVCPISSVMH